MPMKSLAGAMETTKKKAHRYINSGLLNLAACGGAFFRQARPGATSVQSIRVVIKYPGWGHVLLPCKASLPWCDGMWIWNCFHCFMNASVSITASSHARSGPGINMIFLYSLYLPAGRQVLNILSILSKKGNSYAMKLAPFRCTRKQNK